MTTPRPRRHIRLKEWEPHLDRLVRPTDEYVAATNGSLPQADYRLRTDRNGFIRSGDADDSTNDAGLSQVVVLGDSLVESMYVPEAERFVAAAQRLLQARDLAVRCLNGGYSGATTLQLLLGFLAKAGELRPSLVVLIVPVSDVFALVKEGGFWCYGDKRFSPVLPPVDTPPREQAFSADSLAAILPTFIHAVRGLGHRLALATHPHRQTAYAADPWLRRRFRNSQNCAWLQQARRDCNAVVREVANRLEVPLLDLEACVAAQPDWLYDDMHLNVSGSAQVAERLADLIQPLIADGFGVPTSPGPCP